MEQAELRELLHSLDELLGLRGNFWAFRAQPPAQLQEEQLAEVTRELLTQVLGLKL